MPECLNPFTINQGTPEEIGVPCGKCVNCTARRISEWSFRLMQEFKVSHSAYFITFTYDTQHVPITANGYMSLCKRDIQLFFKRLRKATNGSAKTQIKYYCVGEYGSRTRRPHYHALIYNVDISLLQNAWQKGSLHYGNVTEASCGYTLKYMCKKGCIPQHKNDDRVPEFALMSKAWASVTLQRQ